MTVKTHLFLWSLSFEIILFNYRVLLGEQRTDIPPRPLYYSQAAKNLHFMLIGYFLFC